jgi:hypothetical protein
MDGMNTNITNLLRTLLGFVLGVLLAGSVSAQTPTASNKTSDAAKSADPKESDKDEPKKPAKKKADVEPTSAIVGEDAGDFVVTSSIEIGYRGMRVGGDVNKYQSDLNYNAGPRMFDTSFLMKAKDSKRGFIDTLLVTSTGWGADPTGNVRIDAENPRWYRFEAQYRRFKYYRFLNNFVNPNWLFSPIPTPPNPVTGLHGFNTYTHMGDFDLTILPKNETIRFNIGFSPERYNGPAYTNYHNGGNDFSMIANLRSQANEWRFGADGKLGPIDWTFLQGYRRFKDDTIIDNGVGINRNTTTSVAQLTSFLRQEPTRGTVHFTRLSGHSLIARKLDITGRFIYSKTTSNSTYLENFTGINFNFRITGFPPTPPNAQPNTTNPSFYNIASNAERPSTLGDVGITWLATDKLRISNTFRVEDFTIDGFANFSDFFSLTRPITGGTRTDTFSATNRTAFKTTDYRKYQNTIEGDYQFNPNYSVHFGYRYAHRHDEQTLTGFNLGANSPTLLTPEFEEETNNTHAVFGGFRMRPTKNWTIYFDLEHGTADNVFTRIGNYDYTNIRAKTRFSPNRKVHFNLAFISRDNSNPSEIAGVSLSDFGVDVSSRVFTSSIDWLVNPRIQVSTGYNYNWVESDSVIEYFYQVPPAASVFHPQGHALYFQRLNHFFIDVTARLNRRMSLFTSYRINHDNGQGDRLSAPAGTPGSLITSYPMSFQTPEARLAIRLNRHLDWNLGYQYFNYNEDGVLRAFPPAGGRAQNYHAHLPYVSLRLYFGRKE